MLDRLSRSAVEAVVASEMMGANFHLEQACLAARVAVLVVSQLGLPLLVGRQ
jgi:hypothetical protein